MAKYRKKPVVIEAEQWHMHGDNSHVHELEPNNYIGDCKHCGRKRLEHGRIETLEGEHIVCPGDYIITGVQGERYPCKPDIFDATYERVED